MTHPPDDQLARLLADEAVLEGRDALEAHVNHCDRCLMRLEAIRRARPADVREALSTDHQSDSICGAKPRKDKDSRRDNDEPEDAAEVKRP